jgi:hypothetical protein
MPPIAALPAKFTSAVSAVDAVFEVSVTGIFVVTVVVLVLAVSLLEVLLWLLQAVNAAVTRAVIKIMFSFFMVNRFIVVICLITRGLLISLQWSVFSSPGCHAEFISAPQMLSEHYTGYLPGGVPK